MKRALLFLCAALTSCSPGTDGGTVAAAGLDAETELYTDTHGWPHAFGTTLHDAAYAEGYAMARDRMAQMELFRRTSSGTLAQTFGAVNEGFLDSDVTMRTIGLRRTAEAMWQRMPDGRAHALLEGYAAGVNLYLAQLRDGRTPVPRGAELLLKRSTPDWTPVDSLAVLRLMEMFLSFNADAEVNRSLLRDRAREVFEHATDPRLAARKGFITDVLQFAPPSPAVTVPGFYAAAAPPAKRRTRPQLPLAETARALAAIRRVAPATNRLGVGTNAWAMSGAHTASGHALLANDPHLPLIAPSIMWGVHLSVTQGPDALDVTGVAFPGVPGVVFGHNAFVAWGITNAMFDQFDVYEETLEDGAALFQGHHVPLETRVERVPNGLGGFKDVTIETVPHHGPILPGSRTKARALSVRWVAADPSTHEVQQLLELFFSRDVGEAQAAVKDIEVPGMGFVLADSHGAVAFRMVGAVPVRAAGARTYDPVKNPDGTSPAMVLPGTGEAEWVGFVPADQLPASGPVPFVAASNNDPAGLSRDGNPFDERVYLGYEWAEGWRAERVTERLVALDGHATRADMEALQADTTLLVARRFMPFMLAAIGDEPRFAAARAQLLSWDFTSGPESVPAALFHAWLARIIDLALSDEVEALGDAKVQLLPQARMLAVLNMLEHPRPGLQLWDDLRTDAVETRDQVFKTALDAALADLTAATGTADVSRWRWGALHTLRFKASLPHYSLGLGADLSIPAMAEPAFERGGGIESIDQGWPELADASGRPAPEYWYKQGAARRFNVELTPDGPLAFDALPGGESGVLGSPHFRDEAELWRANRSHPLWRTHAEVEANAESRTLLTPR